MNIIQMIDATQKFLEFNFSFEIALVGIFLTAIGIFIVLNTDSSFWLAILGGILFAAGFCVFIFGQTEYYEVPRTNYMIVCDDDVTVKEVMEKYHIIEQAGGALIVTDRDK